jgi:hypothetical protein
MQSPSQILQFLDRSFDEIKIPCFGNMNVDYLASGLLVFRDHQQWLLIFNSIAWCPAGNGLTTIIECIGNGCSSKKFYGDRYLCTGQIEYDQDLDQYLVNVRSKSINVSELNVIAYPDLYSDRECDVAIALLANYREELLANEAEYGIFIPDGMVKILELDEWHHPDWGCPPSQTETFPLIAEVLYIGNPDIYQPASRPNTDWRLWFPK